MKLETGNSGLSSLASLPLGTALAVSLALFANPAMGQSNSTQTSDAPAMSMHKSDKPQSGQETFHSASAATRALVQAMQKDDQQSMLKVLGSNAKDVISSGDAAEDKENRDQFLEKYKQMHRLVMEPDGTTTLYIGAENWPTPIPLVRQGSMWYFDTAAGKQEILYRRIGKNELSAIQVCRELVDAQKEYFAQSHDGGADRQYAQKFSSDAGKHDGLYWEANSEKAASPIGPLVAVAAVEQVRQGSGENLQPFEGYYFHILKSQGPKANGGAESYVVNGKMTRGFAFVAYPAEYRTSGVMTFMVNQDGIVFEKDLGRRTMETAKSMTAYNPDSSWRKAD